MAGVQCFVPEITVGYFCKVATLALVTVWFFEHQPCEGNNRKLLPLPTWGFGTTCKLWSPCNHPVSYLLICHSGEPKVESCCSLCGKCLMKVTQARDRFSSEHFSAPHQSSFYPASAGVACSCTKGISCSAMVQWHFTSTWNVLQLTITHSFMLWACDGLSDRFKVVQVFACLRSEENCISKLQSS